MSAEGGCIMGLRRLTHTLIAVTLFFLAVVGFAAGQTTQGGIAGTIRDSKGASIAGAKITVTNSGTGLARDTITSDNGSFRILALPAGAYEMRVEAPGFATTTTKDLGIGIDQVRTLDLTLNVSGKAETVTVEANADLTQTESTKVGEIIDNRKVEDLPLN